MRGVRVLSLDCTGTLFSFRGSIAEIYLTALRKVNLLEPPQHDVLQAQFMKTLKEKSKE